MTAWSACFSESDFALTSSLSLHCSLQVKTLSSSAGCPLEARLADAAQIGRGGARLILSPPSPVPVPVRFHSAW